MDLLQLNITLYRVFFFSPSPPLSYTSARNMKATQRLDPHLGCTLSFAGLVAAIKLSGNSKKEQGWEWEGGRSAGFGPPEDIICNRVPPLTLRRNSAHFFPPPLTRPAIEFFAGRPFLHFSHVAIRRARHERSASGTNLTPQSRERGGEGEGGKPAADPLFFFFFFLFPCPL